MANGFCFGSAWVSFFFHSRITNFFILVQTHETVSKVLVVAERSEKKIDDANASVGETKSIAAESLSILREIKTAVTPQTGIRPRVLTPLAEMTEAQVKKIFFYFLVTF